jgi:Cu2+-containing amine oxidase
MEIASQRIFKETLTGDRFTVLAQGPAERRSGSGFLRACNIELFDYTKNALLQATIELASSRVLSSRLLKDVQPAIGASELAVARSFAESEARERLSKVLVRPLEQLAINGLIRTDGERCRYHRCVEINYYETGPDAGTTSAAEPPNTQVAWRPIKPLARVIVDLTSMAIVSLEVF